MTNGSAKPWYSSSLPPCRLNSLRSGLLASSACCQVRSLPAGLLLVRVTSLSKFDVQVAEVRLSVEDTILERRPNCPLARSDCRPAPRAKRFHSRAKSPARSAGGFGVRGAVIDRLHGADLVGGQTGARVLARLALQRLRIEMAVARVGEKSIARQPSVLAAHWRLCSAIAGPQGRTSTGPSDGLPRRHSR